MFETGEEKLCVDARPARGIEVQIGGLAPERDGAHPTDDIGVPSRRILGVRVDCLDMKAALELISRLAGLPGPVRTIATVNPEFVMSARTDAQVRTALEQTEICLADGIGVVWALRRRGCPFATRVAGSDLVPQLISLCADRGWAVFLLGAGPGVADLAAARLLERNPNLTIAGTHSGAPAPEQDEESTRLINASRARVLLVAYGHPAQELWIQRNRARLQVSIAMGVGGTLDFISGQVLRAPGVWRRMNLEWLWRLLLQPWRASRMMALPRFALLVLLNRS